MADNEETKYCSNCKRDIAAGNYVMHEVHCKRKIILCKKCEEPIPRSEQDSHDEEYHKLLACELCDKHVEVSTIDEHKENCPKRKVHCAYCEIDCPRDGLGEHMEFCGTRTERCEKCSQFIMHKDRVQHEDTNCEYPPHPEPAVSTNQTSSTANGNAAFSTGDGFGFHDMGSFRSEELMRLIEPDASFLRPRQRPINFGSYANARSRPANQDAHQRPPLRSRELNTGNSRPKPGASNSTRPVISTRNNLRPKNTNVTRNQPKPQNVPNSRSDPHLNLNLSENDHVVSDFSDREALDRLLAVQLGNGLDLATTDFNNMDLHHFDEALGVGAENQFDQEQLFPQENDLSVDDPVSFPIVTNDGASGDDVTVPCEFCREDYPISVLIQHQSGCDQAPADLFTGVGEERTDFGDHDPNNDESRQSNDNGRTDVPVINNIAYMYAQEDGLGGDDFGDDVMIPCEFCDEIYPCQVLLVHQPVCDKNYTKTPRARTPKVANRQAALRGAGGGYYSRTSRHQGDPALHCLQDETFGAAGSSRGTSSYARYGRKGGHTSHSSGMRTQTPEIRRQTSESKVHRTLDSLIQDPTDRPLDLGPEPGARSLGSQAAAESCTRYDPSLASGALAATNFRSKKPKVVPARVIDNEDLEEASGRRTNVSQPHTRKPKTQTRLNDWDS